MLQIREALDQAVHHAFVHLGGPRAWARPLSDDEWAFLDSHKHLAALQRAQTTLEAVAELVYDLRRTYSPGDRVEKRLGPSDALRGRSARRHAHDAALARLFVTHLEQDARDPFRVQAFRRDVLDGTLVTDPARWLLHHVRKQGRVTFDHGMQLLAIGLGDAIVRRAVRAGGTLDRLREISEALARFYRWDPADAATYVLTGAIPPVPALRAEVRLVSPMLARSTITLTIGPTVTPQEVAPYYSQLRRLEFGRVRRLNARHAALAAFVFHHGNMSDRAQMAEWNRTQRSRWRYRFLSVFKREAASALAALLELRTQRPRRS